MQHSKRDNTWSKWGIFLGVAVALGALVVVGWTFMQNRFQPGSSLDADVTIGIDDMPPIPLRQPNACSSTMCMRH